MRRLDRGISGSIGPGCGHIALAPGPLRVTLSGGVGVADGHDQQVLHLDLADGSAPGGAPGQRGFDLQSDPVAAFGQFDLQAGARLAARPPAAPPAR